MLFANLWAFFPILSLSETVVFINSAKTVINCSWFSCSTRIPVFMYLTDYRERSLKDIILKLEPDLFTKTPEEFKNMAYEKIEGYILD